jgi:hypothetical protein
MSSPYGTDDQRRARAKTLLLRGEHPDWFRKLDASKRKRSERLRRALASSQAKARAATVRKRRSVRVPYALVADLVALGGIRGVPGCVSCAGPTCVADGRPARPRVFVSRDAATVLDHELAQQRRRNGA